MAYISNKIITTFAVAEVQGIASLRSAKGKIVKRSKNLQVLAWFNHPIIVKWTFLATEGKKTPHKTKDNFTLLLKRLVEFLKINISRFMHAQFLYSLFFVL